MDDLVERLEFVAKGLDSQWDKEIADDMMKAAAEIRSLREQVEQARRASLSIAWPMNEVGAWTQAVASAAVQQIERHEDKEPRGEHQCIST
jgi:hypothetical protein